MNKHTYFEEQLPLYAAGQLDEAERVEIENHLADCAECQADLELWAAVSGEIVTSNRTLTAPPVLAERALEQVQARIGLATAWLRTWQLLHAQAFLVQREMWPASAAIMALGVVVALVSNHIEAVYFIAPLVAASSLTVLFRPEYDPALELTLATPTSPWKVLLARLSIVSAYNLLLSLGATLALLVIVPPGLFGTLILGWLGPMAFLSALALLLSLWIGTSNAIAITYGLWLAQYVPFKLIDAWMISPAWEQVIAAYQQFWRSPLLLFPFAILLIGMALWSANRPVFRLTQGIG
jgi:hypothetical protein